MRKSFSFNNNTFIGFARYISKDYEASQAGMPQSGI